MWVHSEWEAIRAQSERNQSVLSPLSTDVFILTAESAPRIGELLHPAEPHRIRAKAVRFELALVRPTTPPPPPPPPPGGEGSEGRE